MDDGYSRHRAQAGKRQANQSASGRDIGTIPPVKNQARRDECENNFRRYCEVYFADTFNLGWSEDHLTVIEILERVGREGGQFAVAMPRGCGKTSLVVAFVCWLLSYGHRKFAVPVCATKPLAMQMLEVIRARFETSELIGEDFPEIVYPVRALEGINNRSAGQTCNGERTRIRWTGDRLVFPSIAGAKSSGVVVQAVGLTGSFRGLQTKLGETIIRPDIVILDDPQTDASARQPAQVQKRLHTVNGSALGLAGPGTKLAAVMPCTVIQKGDMADQLLDRDLNPDWLGVRTKLLYEFPKQMELWEKYKEIRAESLRDVGDISQATEYYRDRMVEMKAGSKVAWAERYNPDQLDGLQYAMDLWAKNEAAFFAEFQNEPKDLEDSGGIVRLKAEDIRQRLNNLARSKARPGLPYAVAFVDVQQDALYWMQCAFGGSMDGCVIDYGTYPAQPRRYFELRSLPLTLRAALRVPKIEDAIELGLSNLSAELLKSSQSVGVDANWVVSKDLVYRVARSSEGGRVTPYHGRYIGASSYPMQEWKRQDGDIAGHFWRSRLNDRQQRFVEFDANAWKTITSQGLLVDADATQGVTLYGDRPYEHELLSDHLSAEYGVTVSGRGRKVDEWKQRPGRDNHWWDCLVGCLVVASRAGCLVTGQAEPLQRRRPRLGDWFNGGAA